MRVADMNKARYKPGVAVLDDILYVAGGDDGMSSDKLRSCEKFDAGTNTWSTIASK